MPAVVTIESQIQCPHGGVAMLTTANTQLMVDGGLALLESDIVTIVGCPFTIGPVYSPCVMIQWSLASTTLMVNEVGVVLESSIGLCIGATGAPQGPAIVGGAAPQLEAE